MTLTFDKINTNTRAKREGRVIRCPKCSKEGRVYHFSWSALCCIHCDADVNKLDWRL